MRYLKWLLNYKRLLVAALLVTAIVVVISLEKYTLHNHPWVLGDWLINYTDGGFKRRGLSGSLFFIIQDFTGIPLSYLIFSVQLALYLLFFYLFFLILKNKKITFGYFLLVLSPFFLLFYPNDTAGIGRKEVILLVLYAYLIYSVQRNKLSPAIEYTIVALLIFACLMHELTFFFVPYFLISLYQQSKKQKADLFRICIYASLLFLVLLLLLIEGNPINSGQSFSILKTRGVNFKAGGIFKFSQKPLTSVWANSSTYYLYLFSLLYLLLLLGKFLVGLPIGRRKEYIYAAVFCFLFSLPLFFLALDWGRWLHIHFVLFTIALSAELEEGFRWEGCGITRKDATPANLFWIALGLSLAMKHCCAGITVSKLLTTIISFT